eukprot:CAMPEP_0169296216 /NCGR_PEP_ID=MMETSP1016-20121227/65025_1 /TAXON_ID=342587 /ORGANISM="Karlodinium micrum, Strain CCMP2283" /LENGTH=51 /DNA_ID=CAMNT_0009387599 /DNA_START=87 /DNA_END=242 /DNA_ORIENTATION=-
MGKHSTNPDAKHHLAFQKGVALSGNVEERLLSPCNPPNHSSRSRLTRNGLV